MNFRLPATFQFFPNSDYFVLKTEKVITTMNNSFERIHNLQHKLSTDLCNLSPAFSLFIYKIIK